MQQTIRIAELEVSKGTNEERIVGLFRFRDEKPSSRTPELVILADIDSALYVYEQLLDTINESAERVYHQLSATSGDPMARFEKIIKRLNDTIAQFVESEPSELQWSRVSLYVLELHEQSLCVSGIGHLSNIFLQKTHDGYQVFDVFGSLDIPAVTDPQKLFSALVCGELKAGDVFFAGTSNFERLRGELDLVQRLKTLPPVSAALEVSQELERLASEGDYSGIIASCSAISTRPISVPDPKEIAPAKPQVAKSMDHLYRQEKATEELLSPSLANPNSTYVETDSLPQSSIIDGVKRFLRDIKLRKQSPIALLGKDPTTLAGMRSMGAGHGTMLRQPKTRMYLGILLCFFVLFGVGFAWKSYSNKQFTLKQWTAVYDQALDKRTRAESALLYANEQGAKTLLQESRQLAQTLLEDSDEHKRLKTTLLSEIEQLSTKVRRTVVVEPRLLVSASQGAPAGSLRSPVLFKEKIYVADLSAQTILVFSPNQPGQMERITYSGSSTIDITASASGLTNTYFSTAVGGLLAAQSGQTTVSNASLGTTESIDAMTVYNKRLYALHSQSGTITRHDASGTGFGAGQSYVKQTTKPLVGSSGIAIDSSVYVSWRDGSIKRYLSGSEESWSVALAEPAVTSISSIWTDSAAHDRIVATDPQGKRVLVWRKSDGALIAQLTSPQWNGPTHVTGNGEQKKLYVIDSNQLWQVDLP